MAIAAAEPARNVRRVNVTAIGLLLWRTFVRCCARA
jgi:hypothetical protein